MTKKVFVRDLKPGMFVEDLDRPWIETSFLLQGIMIKSQEDIEELEKYCEFVYVCEERSKIDIHVTYHSINRERPETKAPAKQKEHFKELEDFRGDTFYMNTTTTLQELPAAKEAQQIAQILLKKINDGLLKKHQLDIQAAEELVDVLSDSMIRNPEAMLLLRKIKSYKQTDYERAINISAYLIAFGRHLCLPKNELSELGLGGLLMDIGLIQLEDSSRNDPNHVLVGLEVLRDYKQLSSKVVSIVAQHHEHEDGSGFPNQLRGNEMSPYGRMAAIADNYDLLINGTSAKSPIASSTYEALKILEDWSRRYLNMNLVKQFTHCIGIFPPGSLVELQSGEVAIIISHNRTERFLPNLMIILDKDKKPYGDPIMLDLRNRLTQDKAYEIIQEISKTKYNINPEDYYI